MFSTQGKPFSEALAWDGPTLVFGVIRKCLTEVAGRERVALLPEQRAPVWELPLSRFLPLESSVGAAADSLKPLGIDWAPALLRTGSPHRAFHGEASP